MLGACNWVVYHVGCQAELGLTHTVLGVCDLVVYHVEYQGRVRTDKFCVRSM